MLRVRVFVVKRRQYYWLWRIPENVVIGVSEDVQMTFSKRMRRYVQCV